MDAAIRAELVVEPARLRDLAPAARMFQASTGPADAPDEVQDAELRQLIRRLALLRSIHGRLVVVAKVNSGLAGFAAAKPHGDSVRLVYHFVHPEFRGRGIGRHLLDAICSEIGPDRASTLATPASVDH